VSKTRVSSRARFPKVEEHCLPETNWIEFCELLARIANSVAFRAVSGKLVIEQVTVHELYEGSPYLASVRGHPKFHDPSALRAREVEP
jgi:hypothetical protein